MDGHRAWLEKARARKARADAANREHAIMDSMLGEKIEGEGGCEHHDHFHTMHPETKWEAGIEQGVKIGLGTDQYELITVK